MSNNKVSILFFFLSFVLAALMTCNAFTVVRQPQQSNPSLTSLQADGDFLSGRGKKITVREDEDNAMWIEEPKAKKPDPKKKGGKAEPKTGGFKWPWEK